MMVHALIFYVGPKLKRVEYIVAWCACKEEEEVGEANIVVKLLRFLTTLDAADYADLMTCFRFITVGPLKAHEIIAKPTNPLMAHVNARMFPSISSTSSCFYQTPATFQRERERERERERSSMGTPYFLQVHLHQNSFPSSSSPLHGFSFSRSSKSIVVFVSSPPL
ncbi:hypothetical protein YC2023_027632 [Brassica napus]